MPTDKSFFKIEGVVNPLIVAAVCFLMSLIMTGTRYAVRHRLYRDLVYWRPDISSAVMGDCVLTAFAVINESGLETEGSIEFSFQLYKESQVRILLNEKQHKSTSGVNKLPASQCSIQDEIKTIYLGSKDDQTTFTLKPELGFNQEGRQTVTAKRSIRLENNEALCIAIVLWNHPTDDEPGEHNLYVDERKCKNYAEYVMHKLRLKRLKEFFYGIFWTVVVSAIFAAGIVFNKWLAHKKSIKRRSKESVVETKISEIILP